MKGTALERFPLSCGCLIWLTLTRTLTGTAHPPPPGNQPDLHSCPLPPASVRTRTRPSSAPRAQLHLTDALKGIAALEGFSFSIFLPCFFSFFGMDSKSASRRSLLTSCSARAHARSQLKMRDEKRARRSSSQKDGETGSVL